MQWRGTLAPERAVKFANFQRNQKIREAGESEKTEKPERADVLQGNQNFRIIATYPGKNSLPASERPARSNSYIILRNKKNPVYTRVFLYYFKELIMFKIITPTRELVNFGLYGIGKTVQYRTDVDADNLLESPWFKAYGKFTVTNLFREPDASVPPMKPDIQVLYEGLSEEEKTAFKRFRNMLDGAEAMRLSGIDFTREIGGWLGNITVTATAKVYRNGITKFLRWCEAGKVVPVMISATEAREFCNWLKATGASNPSIRVTIIACKKLFDSVIISHSLRRPNPFTVKGILPPKKRVNELFVPDQAEIEKLLTFIAKNLEVYTAVKLIIKFGMRIGAFEKMKVAGHKAITVTKGKKKAYSFDDEAVNLWRACPLNRLTAKELGERVNYALKKAFQEGLVRHRYTAHKLRHYFAQKTLEESGGDFYKVSKGLGHSNLSATGAYLETLDKESLSGEEV